MEGFGERDKEVDCFNEDQDESEESWAGVLVDGKPLQTWKHVMKVVGCEVCAKRRANSKSKGEGNTHKGLDGKNHQKRIIVSSKT